MQSRKKWQRVEFSWCTEIGISWKIVWEYADCVEMQAEGVRLDWLTPANMQRLAAEDILLGIQYPLNPYRKTEYRNYASYLNERNS